MTHQNHAPNCKNPFLLGSNWKVRRLSNNPEFFQLEPYWILNESAKCLIFHTHFLNVTIRIYFGFCLVLGGGLYIRVVFAFRNFRRLFASPCHPRYNPSRATASAAAGARQLAGSKIALGSHTRSMLWRMEDKSVHSDILEIAGKLLWYALLVVPQKEFVAQKILRRYGLRTFVPMRREWRRRNKFSKEKELREYPVAPRYVFAGFEPGIPLWFELFNLPIVSGVVGLEGMPMLIPNDPMVSLILKTGGGLNAPEVQKFMRTHHEFNVGDLVEVIDGPFCGRKVPVMEIKGPRAKFIIELFGSDREVDIPLDFLQAA